MQQRRFWSKGRDFRKKRRIRKTEFNEEKQLYEAVELEEDVIKKVVTLLWYSGIPVFRERERIPVCPNCHQFVSRIASDPGHPDLHGYVPERKNPTGRSLPFYIEAKRPVGGVESEIQKEFIRRARKHGVLAFFARSWEDVWWNFWGVGIVLPDDGIKTPKR
jgi:hypothetical protein